MFGVLRSLGAVSVIVLVGAGGASAGDGGMLGWMSGDWHLTVGATAMTAPSFEGSKDLMFKVSPLVSLGKAGPEARFSSRNDNISLALIDTGGFRGGVAGKLIFGRDEDDDDDLRGLDPVRFGGEIGGFAEIYPTDWLRVRGEVRQGIRSHDGVVADISADAFQDVSPSIRVSAGPRLSFASADYFDAYYGVDEGDAAASGLSRYSPGGGLKSIGVGGAIDWKATDRITATVFGEYSRLLGPAADSSLVEERGSPNQLMIGVSARYRFDFTL